MKISYSNNTHICVLVLLENKGVILHNYKADMNLIFRGVKGEIQSTLGFATMGKAANLYLAIQKRCDGPFLVLDNDLVFSDL